MPSRARWTAGERQWRNATAACPAQSARPTPRSRHRMAARPPMRPGRRSHMSGAGILPGDGRSASSTTAPSTRPPETAPEIGRTLPAPFRPRRLRGGPLRVDDRRDRDALAGRAPTIVASPVPAATSSQFGRPPRRRFSVRIGVEWHLKSVPHRGAAVSLGIKRRRESISLVVCATVTTVSDTEAQMINTTLLDRSRTGRMDVPALALTVMLVTFTVALSGQRARRRCGGYRGRLPSRSNPCRARPRGCASPVPLRVCWSPPTRLRSTPGAGCRCRCRRRGPAPRPRSAGWPALGIVVRGCGAESHLQASRSTRSRWELRWCGCPPRTTSRASPVDRHPCAWRSPGPPPRRGAARPRAGEGCSAARIHRAGRERGRRRSP